MAKLIEVKRVGWRPAGSSSGYNQFRAVFDGKPELGQVAEAQNHAGYHPAGYGGPPRGSLRRKRRRRPRRRQRRSGRRTERRQSWRGRISTGATD